MIKFSDTAEELTDMSGILFLVFFGIVTAFIITPVIGLIGLLDQNSKRKR